MQGPMPSVASQRTPDTPKPDAVLEPRGAKDLHEVSEEQGNITVICRRREQCCLRRVPPGSGSGLSVQVGERPGWRARSPGSRESRSRCGGAPRSPAVRAAEEIR